MCRARGRSWRSYRPAVHQIGAVHLPAPNGLNRFIPGGLRKTSLTVDRARRALIAAILDTREESASASGTFHYPSLLYLNEGGHPMMKIAFIATAAVAVLT